MGPWLTSVVTVVIASLQLRYGFVIVSLQFFIVSLQFRYSFVIVLYSFDKVRYSFVIVLYSFVIVRYSFDKVRYSFVIVSLSPPSRSCEIGNSCFDSSCSIICDQLSALAAYSLDSSCSVVCHQQFSVLSFWCSPVVDKISCHRCWSQQNQRSFLSLLLQIVVQLLVNSSQLF